MSFTLSNSFILIRYSSLLIMSMTELSEKLEKAFAIEGDEIYID